MDIVMNFDLIACHWYGETNELEFLLLFHLRAKFVCSSSRMLLPSVLPKIPLVRIWLFTTGIWRCDRGDLVNRDQFPEGVVWRYVLKRVTGGSCLSSEYTNLVVRIPSSPLKL